MFERFYTQPPLQPFSPPPTSIPAQEPLTLSSAHKESLSNYLPAPRTKFLREDEPLSNITGSRLGGIPHVTLTYAQSLDSQISLRKGQRTTLSGPETKAMTHYLRANHDAILIGAGTANADNPGLNTRYSEDGTNIVGLERQPRPFILDPRRNWKLEKCEKLFENAQQGLGRAPWMIVTEERESKEDIEKQFKMSEYGGNTIRAGRYGRFTFEMDWENILGAMWDYGIRSVMIEGGAAVINDLLRRKNQHLISSIIVTIAPTYLGSGGVVVTPPRTTTDENEAFAKDLTWIPMGQDIVMAGVFPKTSCASCGRACACQKS